MLNVRALSKEHLEKIHYFLSHPVLSKKIGLINLDQMDLTAVGENVMHRTFGISDFYGNRKNLARKKLKNHFKIKCRYLKTQRILMHISESTPKKLNLMLLRASLIKQL
ncbi:TPA: hypothetical protein JBK40_17500 [Legionella pneumophila]|nr:hypothetical protein [Legionella pneumophila]HAT7810500.1 hypothetical protein [Legionella pneumophila]HAT7820016.1 hypothetical protein [Legionella pneumophila]HAT7829731.1 hypothetical protein [Legionella pneumophila]HAU2019617.1 hypothetical protein [Legionella pneumophila]